MNTLHIVFEIDWRTLLACTAAVILCMYVYKQFFYEDDEDKPE